MTFLPTPVQRPRVPVWGVGAWPHERSMQRAIRWDGLVVQAQGPDGSPATGADVLRPIVDWVRTARADAKLERPFEIVVDGRTPAGDRASAADIAGAHEAAGATWWIEADWDDTSTEALRARIAAGPPRAGGMPGR